MKTQKRILSVTVKKVIDDSPDTSWMGEYSDTPKTEYAIDRAHSLDCASQTFNAQTIEAERILEHAQQTIGDIYNAVLAEHNDLLFRENPNDERDVLDKIYEKLETEQDALDEAYNLLGELADEVSECDCSRSGNMDSREYRYFNGPVENYKGETPEDIRKYIRQDYERMESLQRGQWGFIGIRAEAEITVSIPPVTTDGFPHDSYSVQRITSGGLWGIESDSEESYIAEEEKNQLAELKTQLRALGFSTRAIAKAFQNVEHKTE